MINSLLNLKLYYHNHRFWGILDCCNYGKLLYDDTLPILPPFTIIGPLLNLGLLYIVTCPWLSMLVLSIDWYYYSNLSSLPSICGGSEAYLAVWDPITWSLLVVSSSWALKLGAEVFIWDVIEALAVL